MPRKALLAGLLVLSLALSTSLVSAGNKKKDKKKAAAVQAQMDERQRALHVLNRFTFGPRPGDVDRVMAMGVDKWFEEQLHPDKINDSALEARLSPFRSLNMDTQMLVENFPPRQAVQAVINGRAPLPSDPVKRAIYESQIQKIEDQQARKQAKGDGAPQAANVDTQTANPAVSGVGQGISPVVSNSSKPPDNSASSDQANEQQKAAQREARMYADLKYEEFMAMPAEKRMQAILKMDAQERERFARALRPEDREQLLASLTPDQRETVMALANPEQVVVGELQQGKILRAAYSERQLDEVMTDFWFNHFNVFIGKGPDRYLITSYERDVIRAHALGKFKDLLVATAKSPAMLWYLDNWDSVGPNSEFAKYGNHPARNNASFHPRRPYFGGPFGGRPPVARPQAQQQKKQQKGLNENYARELMELHTLGVDGGYTQKDVTEVARVFTGWTLREPRRGGGYEFDERKHEPGNKTVLGQKIKEDGEKEGMKVLEMLARHPSTARFISTKLATRFVSDNPPPTLVDRMAETFRKSDGDIREVLMTMFNSPEFWSPAAYRAKVKTPLEFVVSSIRATGADINNARPLVQALNRMGMPLYGQQPPTGYPMKAEAWVNSSALLNRMNFALQLGNGRMRGVEFNASQLLATSSSSTAEQAVGSLESVLLAGDISQQTHATILKQLADPQVTGRVLDDASRPPNVGVIAGLLLGSPEFQRR
ncbi:MAG TPA: DUF1800 family protein [Terriglobales bacterium]|nr:DUF1800 family protein [Terriglobales bacterium]